VARHIRLVKELIALVDAFTRQWNDGSRSTRLLEFPDRWGPVVDAATTGVLFPTRRPQRLGLFIPAPAPCTLASASAAATPSMSSTDGRLARAAQARPAW